VHKTISPTAVCGSWLFEQVPDADFWPEDAPPVAHGMLD